MFGLEPRVGFLEGCDRCSRCKRNAAQYLSTDSIAKICKGFGGRYDGRGVGQLVGNNVKLVGIRSSIAIAADGGRDGPDDYVEALDAITLDCSDDVAQAIGRGSPGQTGAIGTAVISGGIATRYTVWNPQVQARPQRVRQLPRICARVEY